MASEIIERLIKIDASQGAASMRELYDVVQDAKKSIEDLDKSSDGYQKGLVDLKTAQAKYNEATRIAVANNENAAGSFNDLAGQLRILKEQWKKTADGDEQKKLTDKINEVKKQMDKMNNSIGNFQSNVGNYKSAAEGFAASFRAVAGGAKSMVDPIKNATNGLRAMSATPAVAILGLLANVINSVIVNLKSSEQNFNATTSAMSVFTGAADLVKATMQTLGKAVSKVAEVLGNLATKIFPKLKEAAELRNEITEKEIALSFKQREAVERNADAELVVAKLRAKAADKEQYTAEQRLEFLEAARDVELQISKRSKEIAEAEYQIQLLRSKTAENSKEENDALAAAYAAKVKAETDYFKKEKELTAAIVAARQQERAEQEKAKKDAEQQAREEERAKIRQLEINKSYWEVRLQQAVKGSEDEFTTRQAILDAEYEIEKKRVQTDVKDADEKVKTLEMLDAKYYERRMALADEFADAIIENERLQYENRMNEQQAGSLEYLQRAIELKKYEVDTISKMQNESDDQFYARRLEKEKEYLAAKQALADEQLAIVQDLASGTASILGSLADIYEADSDNNARAAKKAKALRIASATIDTISGAVGAYMQAVRTTPPPLGAIIGGVQAAAVTAAGVANIAKMKATNVDAKSEPASPSVAAIQSAPAVPQQLQAVTTLTGASQEQRLDDLLDKQSQPVVLVWNDAERIAKYGNARQAEATFR